ncbi:MAG TPA: chemotaxis protein CheA [Methylomirabilota bacterium]|nr:chemotaxis protein CheA [Methylomirabilota bacterium]
MQIEELSGTELAGKIVLEGQVHGESGRGRVCEKPSMGTKEKNRKNGAEGKKQAVARPEAEQVKEEGMGDEIVREFLLESNENLDRLDRELVSLEKDPRNRETLSSIFRTIHTIKGTCGFLAFGKLESVAHAGESLLSLLRDGAIELTPERTTALLSLVDAVRQMLGSIERSGNEGGRNDGELIETLKRLQKDSEVKEVNEVKEKKSPVRVAVSKTENGEDAEHAEKREEAAGPPKQLGKILVEMGTVTPEDVAYAVQKQLEGDKRSIGEILVERGMLKSQDLMAAVQVQLAARSAVSESSIRVDVVLLDRLMNLVGELVLARNQILLHTQGVQDAGLAASGQRLNLITSELQEGVMKTRMQPIGNIWSKFPRTVRDVAMSCGKSVRIEMEGKETELDKTIIEAIKDPLTHLVRNSVDHGIETPEKRVQAGKSEEGLLLLRAYHEGGQVNIEIRDDGAGLNTEKIKKKAVQRRLITTEQAERMSEDEACNLIFLAGFSTAEAVTNVSGRGVGMDVVKTNIEKIGGTVQVQTRAGSGTTVKMKIPLTVAIIPALLVTSGGERFAIPQVNLLELVRIKEQNVEKRLERVQGAPVYRLRGQLLPLVNLNDELRLEGGKTKEDGGVNIIVLQADARHFGLVVDQVNDTEEIVVKPLNKQLKSIRSFAGATILGDGRVALILDVRGLAESAGILDVRHEEEAEHELKSEMTDMGSPEKQSLLVFENRAGSRMAIELSMVARLEEFPRESVEKTGELEVVQYRGKIMPLIRVEGMLETENAGTKNAAGERPVQVVVYTDGELTVGLVVEQILDIVEEKVVLQQPAKRPGVRGTMVIQKKVTDLLDVMELIRMNRGKESVVGEG